MKHLLSLCLILSILLANGADPDIFEQLVYAFHNPRPSDGMVLQARGSIAESRLALYLEKKGCKSDRFDLVENFIYMNGKLYDGPISALVAGGIPQGSTDRSTYEYFPAKRFFIFAPYLDTLRAASADASSEDETLTALERIFNPLHKIQKLAEPVAVVKEISALTEPVVVVDLSRWLDLIYGLQKKKLPVRFVPQEIGFLDASPYEYKAVSVTQEELERSMKSKCKECVLL
jgi:hypothetical protein